MTTKKRLSAMEKAIGQGATTPRKPVQEMSDDELARVIGVVDIRELTDDDLWKIIERNLP